MTPVGTELRLDDPASAAPEGAVCDCVVPGTNTTAPGCVLTLPDGGGAELLGIEVVAPEPDGV